MSTPELVLLPSASLFLLVLCRVAPLVALCPFVGWGTRALLSLFLSAIFATLLPAVHSTSPSLLLMPRELLIGGGLALFALLPGAVLRSVGELLDETLLTGGQRLRTDDGAGAAARILGLLAVASLSLAPLFLSLATSYQLAPLSASSVSGLSPTALSEAGTRLVFYTVLVGLPLAGARLGAELLGAVLGRMLFGGRAMFTRLSALFTLAVVVAFSTVLIAAALALWARAPGDTLAGLRLLIGARF